MSLRNGLWFRTCSMAKETCPLLPLVKREHLPLRGGIMAIMAVPEKCVQSRRIANKKLFICLKNDVEMRAETVLPISKSGGE